MNISNYNNPGSSTADYKLLQTNKPKITKLQNEPSDSFGYTTTTGVC